MRNIKITHNHYSVPTRLEHRKVISKKNFVQITISFKVSQRRNCFDYAFRASSPFAFCPSEPFPAKTTATKRTECVFPDTQNFTFSRRLNEPAAAEVVWLFFKKIHESYFYKKNRSL